MNILERHWETTLKERQAKGIQVPYMANEFMDWLAKYGYKDSTIHIYVVNLLDLDKFIVKGFMPMVDVYEEFPTAYTANDTNRLRRLCKEYEMYINTHLSHIKGAYDEDTELSAEYDELRKYRSVWRTYSKFICSLLKNGTTDKETDV